MFAIALCADPIRAVTAAEVDISKLPPPAAREIDFDKEVRPIFEAACLRCHGPERPRSRFRLDHREAALKGGENGVAIIVGQSARSPLIHYVARLVEDMEMPPEGKGDPLTNEQIAVLRAWIDQGAKWPAQEPEAAITYSVTPALRWISVSGDRNLFREHTWMNDRWSGGFQEFQYRQRLGPDETLGVEGRAFLNGHDYRVRLSLDKRDVGYARFGFEQYRHYYDDTGGYYAPFATNSFDLDQTLALDIGRAWVDLGLTLPDWPKLALGYEYQFKEGSKSSLTWSDVLGRGGDIAAIYPAFKEIDEKTHVIKFDVSHEINGVLLEDNFRAEFYDLETSRVTTDLVRLGRPPTSVTATGEAYDHFQAVNTFRLEKQLRDWLFFSGGYLYSKLDGDAAFTVAGFVPSDPSAELFLGDVSRQVVLERWSHVLNLNMALGPWEGLTAFAGVQNEWTREKGLGDALAPNFPEPSPRIFTSDRDKMVLEENFGLRYTAIPFTVFYAETRFQQEGIDHFERQIIDDTLNTFGDFLRDTDATGDLKEFRGGFSVSPWQRVSFHSSYKHRLKQSHYDHRTDSDGSDLPGNGYPAFIHSRDIEMDEVESRLSIHWSAWLKTSLKHQRVATDYTTATDPSLVTFFDPMTFMPIDVRLPGGEILAGNHDAHIYSFNATVRPWRRLYLSTTLSYTDSRIRSGIKDGALVDTYKGDVYSALANATFLINETTDWQSAYSFSRADYQRGDGERFPTGIDYDRHGLVSGITKRFRKNLTTKLEYGFFRYDAPSAGGVNDYTAHAVLASVSVVLR